MTGLEILEIITVVWFLISLEFSVGTENEWSPGRISLYIFFVFAADFQNERGRVFRIFIFAGNAAGGFHDD